MTSRVVALVYADGARADAVLRGAAGTLGKAGRIVAGLLPHAVPRPGRSRCDMVLEDPLSGERIRISEDRGENARGCRLDLGELLRAGELILQALSRSPDVVVVNKFGKSESEGRGLRDVLAEVVGSGTPLLIAVPRRNLDAWRLFMGGAYTEVVLNEGPVTDEGWAAAIVEAIEG
jgi:nucleoside-triphosphatase THEP1